jgi:thiol-disulfide isomerase/thioredoxin
MRHWVAVLLAVLAVGTATAQEEDVPDPDGLAKAERGILDKLNASPNVGLKCDFVVNSAATEASLPVPVVGKVTVLNFWRPSCGPCKPLLEKLAAYSRKAPSDVVVLAAAEGGSLYGERVDSATARQLISPIVTRYMVSFPVCGYTDHTQTKAWQAEGVPLTVVFNATGRVSRVALGGDEGLRLVEQLEKGWRP